MPKKLSTMELNLLRQIAGLHKVPDCVAAKHAVGGHGIHHAKIGKTVVYLAPGSCECVGKEFYRFKFQFVRLHIE